MVLLHLFFKKLFNLKRIIDNIKIYPVLYQSQLNSNKLIKPTTKDGKKKKKERGRRMETKIGKKKKTTANTGIYTSNWLEKEQFISSYTT